MRKTLFIKSALCISAVALATMTVKAADDTASPQKPRSDSTTPTQRVGERQTSPATGVFAPNEKGVDSTATTDADNTRRNKRDKDNATLTPGDQGNTKEDIEVTRQIRRGIVKDKSLSTTAKNVKIITKNGNVTLRGPVKSDAEKDAILAKAKELATTAHPVTDELEVKADIDSKRQIKPSDVNVQNK